MSTMQPKVSIPTVLFNTTEPYTPNLVTSINNEYDVKVARTKGGFIWHSHLETDEFFYVLSGSMTIEIEGKTGREDVELGPGDTFVVPMGVRHRPVGTAEILMIERIGVVNTGDEKVSEFTKELKDARAST